MSQEARLFQESTFSTSDGESLYFRHWPAAEGNGKKVIVLFHRGHEHSGRLQHIVDELDMPDTHFYAWDTQYAHGDHKSDEPANKLGQYRPEQTGLNDGTVLP
ncbi:hypothetical protein EKINANG_05400 [Enterobacter sp. KINAN-G]|nr:hypothetical protein EKINANG_05400 [Enterobacter sp. KINAN-G]